MTSQQNKLDYSLAEEVNDIYHMALNHFKEHVIPAKKRNQQLLTDNTTSQGLSFPTFNFSPLLPLELKLPSEFKLKDDRLIDNQRKEISELKLKVRQTFLQPKNLYLMYNFKMSC